MQEQGSTVREVAKKRERTRAGRYTYEGNFDRVCKCGRTLGQHTAAAPHECDETGCEKFRPVRTRRDAMAAMKPDLVDACERQGFRLAAAAAGVATIVAGERNASFVIDPDGVKQVHTGTGRAVDGGIFVPAVCGSPVSAFRRALALFAMTRGAK